MPVAVACPKCQKKYNLPDKMLGKPVKCTQCAAQFRTPAPTQKRQTDPRQVALQQQAAAAARKRAGELQKLGVDGPIQKAPDVFDGLSPMQGTADPLNNMALEDPGFADVRSQAVVIDEGPVDPNADMFANPALAPKKKKAKKKSKSKKGNAPLYMEPWFWISVIFLPLFGAIALLAWLESVSYETGGLLLFGTYIFYALASLAIAVYGVILCYRNTPSVTQV